MGHHWVADVLSGVMHHPGFVRGRLSVGCVWNQIMSACSPGKRVHCVEDRVEEHAEV